MMTKNFIKQNIQDCCNSYDDVPDYGCDFYIQNTDSIHSGLCKSE